MLNRTVLWFLTIVLLNEILVKWILRAALRWSSFGVFSYSGMADAENTTSVTQALTIEN